MKMQKFIKDTSGSALTVTALAIAMIMASATIAVDMGYAYVIKSRLQGAADSAAMAGATELPDETNARARAKAYAALSMPAATHGTVLADADVTVGNWADNTRVFTANGNPVNAVRVITRRSDDNGNPLGMFFGRALGIEDVNISRMAIAARRVGDAPPCVMTLATSGNNSLYLDSNADIDLTNCSVHVNSSNGDALNAQSNSTLGADETCVVGGYSGGASHYSPAPTTGCDVKSDPFADVDPPSVGSCNYNNTFVGDSDVVTLTPGVYCGGITIDADADVTFAPGEYIVKDGQFEVLSNAQVSGSGVGFYLTGSNSTIFFDSNTSPDFTAPTTGDLAGMVFFQDRNASGTHRIDSNFIGGIEGAMYFPNGDFVSDSNSSLTGGGSNCAYLLAQNIEFNSSATFEVDQDLDACGVPLPGPNGWGIALRK